MAPSKFRGMGPSKTVSPFFWPLSFQDQKMGSLAKVVYHRRSDLLSAGFLVSRSPLSGSEKGVFWKRGLFGKVHFLENLEILEIL